MESPLLLLVRMNTLSLWRRFKAIKDQSRLLTAVIAAFIAGYLGVAFLLFYGGLRWIGRFPGLGTTLTDRLLFLLFAFLFALLLLSNLVISYTNLFRNRETAYLLTLPIPTDTIFQWKFIETTVLASWAFVFLVAPLLAAYGLTRAVPWHFYPFTVLMVALFVFLPGVAGAWVAVNVARYLDRRLFQVVTVVMVALLLGAAAWWFKPTDLSVESMDARVQEVLDRILGRTSFADFAWLPSRWLSSSVLFWSEGALTSAAFFALVLLSYVLFFGTLAFTKMGDLFYDASSVVHSRSSVFARWAWFQARKRRLEELTYAPGWLERCLGRLGFLSQDVRAMVVKDIRAFWRDTTQWAQSLMLFGLLGVYIFNLRHFSQQLGNAFWINLVSFLNLGACSLNLATLTTRFVFPQFSLEGKRLWIVGLAPLGLAGVVKVKYWLATCASLIVTVSLILLSCHMLDMAWRETLFFVAAVTVMTFTLNGLAVGLGVLYPNFKEDNPSKIVSGFGGTFCLVLSFLYILGSVLLLAMTRSWTGSGAAPPEQTALCMGVFFALSVGLGWLPLVAALRRLSVFEL